MEEVFARKMTPQLRRALNQLIGEARAHLAKALELVAASAKMRALFVPLALVRYDLERMARANVDFFNLPARSRLRTLWILWRASRASLS
jgi:phytoene synthase